MNHENMKMTEIGWIPKNWECKQLEGCSFIKARIGWQGLTKSEYLSYGTYYLVGGTNFENGRVNWNTCSFVTKERYEQDKYIQIRNHDVLISKDGTIGKVAYVNGFDGQGTLNSGVFVVRPKSKDIDQGYFAWSFLSMYFDDFIARLTAESTIKHLYQKDLVNFQFPLPSKLSEQRRIAQVLSDTDSLIASLSRTIAKKRIVKQGAMQQLLTGKTRLKGYSGEWVEKIIGNIGKTYNGITGKTKADFGCGNARYITFLNVLNNPIIDTNILEKVNINFDEGQNEVRRGDLFFNTSSEIPEEVGICATLKQNVEEVYLNSFCFGFRLSDEEIDNQYLAYYFRSEQGRALMTMLAQGATRYNLSKDNFNKSCIVLPPTKDEQQAIANILTTMDNEIASLEAELQKYKALKQGMMQKLLTGQIRLKVCQDTNA